MTPHAQFYDALRSRNRHGQADWTCRRHAARRRPDDTRISA